MIHKDLNLVFNFIIRLVCIPRQMLNLVRHLKKESLCGNWKIVLLFIRKKFLIASSWSFRVYTNVKIYNINENFLFIQWISHFAIFIVMEKTIICWKTKSNFFLLVFLRNYTLEKVKLFFYCLKKN